MNVHKFNTLFPIAKQRKLPKVIAFRDHMEKCWMNCNSPGMSVCSTGWRLLIEADEAIKASHLPGLKNPQALLITKQE